MRNIKFTEVGMENYGPYIEPLEIKIGQNKIIFITGPNGVGKTMALDAIPFSLFGITSKGMKGDDVVNNVVGKNCKTWLSFLIDDISYRVERFQKYTKLGTTVHLFRGSEQEPYKKGQKEVLPEIERLVCPQRSFMNTIMFGQKVKDFFTDLVDSDKKEIFRKILNLGIYQIYYKKSSEILDVLESEVEKNNKEQDITSQLIKDTIEQKESLNKLKIEFENNRENQIKEMKISLEDNKRILQQWEDTKKSYIGIEEDLSKIIDKIRELTYKLDTINTEYNNNLQKLESSRNQKIAEVRNDATKARNECIKKYSFFESEIEKKYQDQIDILDNEKTVILNEQRAKDSIQSSVSTEIKILEEQKEELIRVLETDESVCPTCFQTIGEECKSNVQNKVNEINANITRKIKDLELIKENVKKVTDKIGELDRKKSLIKNGLKDEIEIIQSKKDNEMEIIDKREKDVISKVEEFVIHEKEKELEKVSNKKIELKETYDLLIKEKDDKEKQKKEADQLNEKINNLKNTISLLEYNLKRKEEESFDLTLINNYEKKIYEYEIKKKLLEKQYQDLSNHFEKVSFWKTAYSPSGIPSMLIDEAIPFMNERVGEYLDKLTNGRYIVSFDTLSSIKSGELRDKISVNVLDTYTRANTRVQLSGGQTRIIDIATILTLGDLQSIMQDVSFNILLFDEIFDALDEENIGLVSKVLQKLKETKTICLISHRYEDQVETDEVLTFK